MIRASRAAGLAAAAVLSFVAVPSAKAEDSIEAQASFAAKDFDLSAWRGAAPGKGPGVVTAAGTRNVGPVSGTRNVGPLAAGTRNVGPLSVVPSPRQAAKRTRKAEPPKPAGSTVGAKILTGAGTFAGFIATLGLIGANPLAYATLLAGGAVVGVLSAKSRGEKGWELAREGAFGAAEAGHSIIGLGTAAGRTSGIILERLFSK